MRQYKSSPLFTQRHYEWLAEFCGERLPSEHWLSLATELKRDNPRFKRGHFLAACLRSAPRGTSITSYLT